MKKSIALIALTLLSGSVIAQEVATPKSPFRSSRVPTAQGPNGVKVPDLNPSIQVETIQNKVEEADIEAVSSSIEVTAFVGKGAMLRVRETLSGAGVSSGRVGVGTAQVSNEDSLRESRYSTTFVIAGDKLFIKGKPYVVGFEGPFNFRRLLLKVEDKVVWTSDLTSSPIEKLDEDLTENNGMMINNRIR